MLNLCIWWKFVSLQQVAKRLSGHWKELATELKFGEDEISYVEEETTDKDSQAHKILIIWLVSVPAGLAALMGNIALAWSSQHRP